MTEITRTILPDNSFIPTLMSYVNAHFYVIAGSSSFYVPKIKTKFLLYSHTTPWVDLGGSTVPMTASEAARTELAREFPGVTRVGWSPMSIELFDVTPPMAIIQQYKGFGVYADLEGAYNSIYRKLCLNCLYPRGLPWPGQEMNLRDIASRLRPHKAIRNSLMGVIRSKSTIAYVKGERKKIKIKNPYLSPHLWRQVQGVLHDVALLALANSAIYVNTDGYIFTDYNGYMEFWQKVTEAGLVIGKERVGKVDVVGWNNYAGRPGNPTFLYQKGDKPREFTPFIYCVGDGKDLKYWSKL